MGNSFRKMFDSLFGNREMRVVMLGAYRSGRPTGLRAGGWRARGWAPEACGTRRSARGQQRPRARTAGPGVCLVVDARDLPHDF